MALAAVLAGAAAPLSARATPAPALLDVSPEVQSRGLRPFTNHPGPVVLYLATEGVTIQAGPTSDALAAQSNLCAAVVPPFDPTVFGASRVTVVADLAQQVAKLFAAYDVQVVTTRPAAGPYNLVAIGGTPGLCKLPDGYSGYAPLDCGDAGSSSDVVFVFAEGITHLGMLAVIIAHEVGHAHGLPHTDEACDVMSNLLCHPDDKRFFDKDMGITADHQGRCGLGTQANSHALLLGAIGPVGGGDAGGSDGAIGEDAGADGGSRDAGDDPADLAGGLPGDAGADVGGESGDGGGGCAMIVGRAFASGRGGGLLGWPALLLGFWVSSRRRQRVSAAPRRPSADRDHEVIR